MNRNLLLAAAGGALAAGTLGLLVGRSSAPAPTPSATESGRTSVAVALAPARIRAAGIEVVQVGAAALDARFTAPGDVAAQIGAEGVLAARADGTIVRLLKRLGDSVTAGEVVAVIESQQAADIAAQGATARANLAVAQAKYDREARLYAERVTARQDLETARAELANARAEARRTSAAASAARVSGDGRTLAVTSLTHGRISAAPAKLGAFVSAGSELYRVVDPRRIEIRVSLPAQDARRVAIGAAASVTAEDPGTIAAVVRSVTPEVDPVSRAATVVLVPLGSASALRVGQSVRASIAASGSSAMSVLTVPAEAVQLLDGQDIVFVRTRTGFRPQSVVVGTRTADRVEIVSGLQPGIVIAGRNAFLIKAEMAKGEDEDS